MYMFDFLENQPEYKHNMYNAYVWDYYGRAFSADSIENGTHFYPNLKIINQFGLRLLWDGFRRKELSYKFGEQSWEVRGVFGYNHSIDFPHGPNSNITITHKDVIITEFLKGNQYKQYIYNLDKSSELSEIEDRIQDFKVKINGLKYTTDAEYEHWSSRNYSYNYNEVYRYHYKNSIITQINKENFVDIENIQFIKCNNLL